MTVMRSSFERQRHVKPLMRPIKSPVDGHPCVCSKWSGAHEALPWCAGYSICLLSSAFLDCGGFRRTSYVCRSTRARSL
jgi:hypothetical protein